MSESPRYHRNPSDAPSLQELLDCLSTYPEGTHGHHDETALIMVVHTLCVQHGFGRISQLVKAVESIWRKDKKTDKWIKFFADLRKLRHEMAKNANET